MSEENNILPFPGKNNLEKNNSKEIRENERLQRKKRALDILEKIKKSSRSEISTDDAVVIAKNIGSIFSSYNPKDRKIEIKDLFKSAFPDESIFDAKYKKRKRFIRLDSDKGVVEKKGSISKNGSDFSNIISSLYKTLNVNGEISSDLESIFVIDSVRGTSFDDKPKQYSDNTRKFVLYDFIKRIEERILKETSVLDYFSEIYKFPTKINKDSDACVSFSIATSKIDEYRDTIHAVEVYEDYEGDYNDYNDLFPSIDIGEIYYELMIPHFEIEGVVDDSSVNKFINENNIDFEEINTFAEEDSLAKGLGEAFELGEEYKNRKNLKYSGIFKSIWESYVVKMGVKPSYDAHGNATLELFLFTTSNPYSALNRVTIHPSVVNYNKWEVDTVSNHMFENFSSLYRVSEEYCVSFGSKNEVENNDRDFIFGRRRMCPDGKMYNFSGCCVYSLSHSVFVDGYFVNSESDYCREYYDRVYNIHKTREPDLVHRSLSFGMSDMRLYLDQKIHIVRDEESKFDYNKTGIKIANLYDETRTYFRPYFDLISDNYIPYAAGTLGNAIIGNITYCEGENIILNKLINMIDIYTKEHEVFMKKNKENFFEMLNKNGIDY